MHSVRTVALVVGAPLRWVDNLLSQHDLPGVTKTSRGTERRIDETGMLGIAITRALWAEFGISLRSAVELSVRACALTGATTPVRMTQASGVVIEVPVEMIRHRIRDRLVEATEAVAHIRRGRPPSRSTQE